MRILVFRSGAYGDNLVITPVIRFLNLEGHELVVCTSGRGMEVFKNNPHIKELVRHDESTPVDKLSDRIDYLRRRYKCDKVYDFSESIEVALSQHPRSPNYKLPKQERIARFNRNFYEYAFEHAGLSFPFVWGHDVIAPLNLSVEERIAYRNSSRYKPRLYFDESELSSVQKYIKSGQFNVLMGLSGSGTNKVWPWGQDFCLKLCDDFPDVHIITVGDEKCRLIEPEREGRITNLSGKISMREAMALTKLVDLVIAPDTGIAHASGCWDTPKIILLGHNTKECITKHFKNDFSIEADPSLAPCSPCLYLIYDMKIQCPLHEITQSSLCMSSGISQEVVYEKFKMVY